MRALFTVFAAFSLAALLGCGGSNTGTSEKHAGGAVTNPTERAPLVGQAEGQFALKPPTLATHLKQGEQKVVKIDIDRGKNFDEDVTLKFEGNMPKGVTFDPASPTIKHGDKEASVTVKAADDAAVGDFEVRVVGKPTKGKEAANTLKIDVAKK
jgi:uncharacterized membrane protein